MQISNTNDHPIESTNQTANSTENNPLSHTQNLSNNNHPVENNELPPEGNEKIQYNLNQRSTFFITAISNKLTQHATSLLKSDFAIGLVDWRCIATLAYETSCSAALICKISGMNKSLVSQSLSCLRELGYVVRDESSVSKKPEFLKLSETGIDLHQEIIKKVHHFETELTEGLNEEERGEFIRLLTHVYKKMKSS